MIIIETVKDTVHHRDFYDKGVHAVPEEYGWISILDDDGLTLAMYPKDIVIAIKFKAGEAAMSEDSQRLA